MDRRLEAAWEVAVIATLKGGPRDGEEIVVAPSVVLYFTPGPRYVARSHDLPDGTVIGTLSDVGVYRLRQETEAGAEKVQFVWDGWT